MESDLAVYVRRKSPKSNKVLGYLESLIDQGILDEKIKIGEVYGVYNLITAGIIDEERLKEIIPKFQKRYGCDYQIHY